MPPAAGQEGQYALNPPDQSQERQRVQRVPPAQVGDQPVAYRQGILPAQHRNAADDRGQSPKQAVHYPDGYCCLDRHSARGQLPQQQYVEPRKWHECKYTHSEHDAVEGIPHKAARPLPRLGHLPADLRVGQADDVQLVQRIHERQHAQHRHRPLEADARQQNMQPSSDQTHE